MACSVSKNSNSTAKSQATPAEFSKILSNGIKKENYSKKITKTDKYAKKTCSLGCQARVVIDVHY